MPTAVTPGGIPLWGNQQGVAIDHGDDHIASLGRANEVIDQTGHRLVVEIQPVSQQRDPAGRNGKALAVVRQVDAVPVEQPRRGDESLVQPQGLCVIQRDTGDTQDQHQQRGDDADAPVPGPEQPVTADVFRQTHSCRSGRRGRAPGEPAW
jgi:hypothetical protein